MSRSVERFSIYGGEGNMYIYAVVLVSEGRVVSGNGWL